MNYRNFLKNLKFSMDFWTQQNQLQSLQNQLENETEDCETNLLKIPLKDLLFKTRKQIIDYLFKNKTSFEFSNIEKINPIETLGYFRRTSLILFYLGKQKPFEVIDILKTDAFDLSVEIETMNYFERVYYTFTFIVSAWILFIFDEILTKNVHNCATKMDLLRMTHLNSVVGKTSKEFGLSDELDDKLKWGTIELQNTNKNLVYDYMGTPLAAVLENLNEINPHLESRDEHYIKVYEMIRFRIFDFVDSFEKWQTFKRDNFNLISSENCHKFVYFLALSRVNLHFRNSQMQKLLLFFADLIDSLFHKFQMSMFQNIKVDQLVLDSVFKLFENLNNDFDYLYLLKVVYFSVLSFNVYGFLKSSQRQRESLEGRKVRRFLESSVAFANLGTEFAKPCELLGSLF